MAGLLLAPFLTGCFAPNDSGSPSSDPSGSGAGARLRVALAFAPTEHYSPYGQDAFIMSRLDVSEGLTKLDANGTAIPSLAESWSSDKDDKSWVFTLRHATFQDGTEVTAKAVASALNHAARAEPRPPP
jgi:peptide/nickel transport system substrate-binding protein